MGDMSRRKQMAEPTKVCGECGQKIRKLNPHSMDSQKVRVLEDIAKLNHQGYEWVLVKRLVKEAVK